MKLTKTFLAVACVAATLALFSCDTAGDDGNEVVFKDQTLQGTINGKAYTFVSGYAEKDDTDDSYDIELYNIANEAGKNPWDLNAYPPFGIELQVNFEVPAKVGRTDLFLDTDTGENMMVNLLDWDDGASNILAHIGAVEITAIDTTAYTITGRIAASNGEGSEVNGNFTVPIEH